MCTLFAPFLHNIGTVNRFVPSWCCQINQSKYACARYLLCPLTTLVLSDKPVCICARYLLCPHATLVLSDKPVVHAVCCVLTQRWCYKTNRSCTLFAVSSRNVGTVRRSCLDLHGMFSVLHDCLNCRWSLMSDSGSERRV